MVSSLNELFDVEDESDVKEEIATFFGNKYNDDSESEDVNSPEEQTDTAHTPDLDTFIPLPERETMSDF